MTWTCVCDAVNVPKAAYCEHCGLERPGGPAIKADGPKNAGLRWSPETPPVSALQAWTGTRWVVPAAIRAELDALKAKLTTPGAGRAIDPDQERAYLENCAKRPREQEAPRCAPGQTPGTTQNRAR